MKTLAIRLEDHQHAQLTMIAQLEQLTIVDAIRQAINEWVDARKDRPELKARAQSLLDEIEQEAAARRGAIAALLSDDQPAPAKAPTPPTASPRRSSGRSRPKGGEEA